MIGEWNEITERTLIDNAKPISQSILFDGFTALAMYDAVVIIEGGFVQWSRLPPAPAPLADPGVASDPVRDSAGGLMVEPAPPASIGSTPETWD